MSLRTPNKLTKEYGLLFKSIQLSDNDFNLFYTSSIVSTFLATDTGTLVLQRGLLPVQTLLSPVPCKYLNII